MEVQPDANLVHAKLLVHRFGVGRGLERTAGDLGRLVRNVALVGIGVVEPRRDAVAELVFDPPADDQPVEGVIEVRARTFSGGRDMGASGWSYFTPYSPMIA